MPLLKIQPLVGKIPSRSQSGQWPLTLRPEQAQIKTLGEAIGEFPPLSRQDFL